jgi:hypothetical protein
LTFGGLLTLLSMGNGAKGGGIGAATGESGNAGKESEESTGSDAVWASRDAAAMRMTSVAGKTMSKAMAGLSQNGYGKCLVAFWQPLDFEGVPKSNFMSRIE